MKTCALYGCLAALAASAWIATRAQDAPLPAPGPAPAPISPPAPAPVPPFLAGGGPVFQPITVDPALVRQSIQARSEYEELNRRVQARITTLYDETPAIRSLQEEMRALQKKIDGLLAQDQELNALKKKFEAFTPDVPMGLRIPCASNAPTPAD